jgi:YVTN family beta-propeller protein
MTGSDRHARRRSPWLALLALLCGAPPAAHALPISVRYVDQAGSGFDDPLRGAARRAALEHAVAQIAASLAGDVPIVVQTAMVGLGGSESSAVLARTFPISLHRNFPSARPGLPVRPGTWYGAALASQIGGRDANGPDDEIAITFNSDVDGPLVLGAADWYYGTDEQPGAAIDFVTVALHELGHGLNFYDLIDPTSGAPLIEGGFGIFEQFLERIGVGTFPRMRQGERLAAITSGQLVWSGPNVLSAARAPVALYAPAVFEPGSSLSHWDTALSPDEIIEPFYTGANHDLGLLLPALQDMGWELAISTATPRSTAPIVPTPTQTASPTETPATAQRPGRVFAYVTNFDDGTVSVIDDPAQAVIATLRVGAGPLGVAASADGTRVYVANFHAGSLSVLSTARRRVIANIPVSESAHSVALSPDERLAYVTDTFTGMLAVVDLAQRQVVGRIAVGPQPAGLAVSSADARVFVTSYGGNAVWVVDPLGAGVVALIPFGQPSAPLGVSLAPRLERGHVASQFGGLIRLDLLTLFGQGPEGGVLFHETPEAVAYAPDQERFYAVTHDGPLVGRLRIFVAGPAGGLVGTVTVGSVPEALGIRPDGERVYVANTGDGTVSVVDPAARSVLTTIPVGAAPMGVVVIEEPASRCAGDCRNRGAVVISDLLTAVQIALGRQPLAACGAADADGDGTVIVAEIIAATANALHGCRE